MVVENGVDQAGDARVKKGRVADKRYDFLVGCLGKAARGTDRGSHADQEVAHGHGGQEAQGVAADIRRIDGVHPFRSLFDGIKGCPMGTAGTKIGRPLGYFGYICQVCLGRRRIRDVEIGGKVLPDLGGVELV